MATILVADDNSNIQKMVSLAFQEKGIRVVAVGNGEAACRKVPEVRPDIVLADVFMPVRNGYEVCEFVKQDPEFAEIPVVLLVGAFDPLDEKEAARVGANGVLKKPFVPPEPLISLVNSLLNKAEPEEPAPQKPADHPNIEYATKVPFVAPARKTASAEPEEFQFNSSSKEPADEVQTAQPIVAVPESQNAEEDDLGPENEWAQRRKTMDYEIDAADSASLVERLAGEGDRLDASGAGDDEILASNKHLPFGGANIPEISRPSKWAGFPKSDNESADSTADQKSPQPDTSADSLPDEEATSYTYEGSAPDLDLPDPTAKIAGSLGPSELLGVGQDVIPFRPPERHVEETVETSSRGEMEESAVKPEAVTLPLQEDGLAEESSNRATAHWMDAISGGTSPTSSPTDEATIEPAEPSIEFSEESHSGAGLPAKHESRYAEDFPGATAPSETEKVDASTVDDVVAKVISRLEPQLHQALANGVLRPLVEELLNEKQKKK